MDLIILKVNMGRGDLKCSNGLTYHVEDGIMYVHPDDVKMVCREHNAKVMKEDHKEDHKESLQEDRKE